MKRAGSAETRSGTETPSSISFTSARSTTASGDGIGDFVGLTQKLSYLKSLGVSCLWLLPFYPSPLRTTGTTSPATRRSTRPTGR